MFIANAMTSLLVSRPYHASCIPDGPCFIAPAPQRRQTQCCMPHSAGAPDRRRPMHVVSLTGVDRRAPYHLPMQNSLNTLSSTASVSIAPVRRPSARAAARSSSAASSAAGPAAWWRRSAATASVRCRWCRSLRSHTKRGKSEFIHYDEAASLICCKARLVFTTKLDVEDSQKPR